MGHRVLASSHSLVLAEHGLHNHVVHHIVAVQEKFVLQLLAHVEEAQLGDVSLLIGDLFLVAIIQVLLFQLVDLSQVGDGKSHVSNNRASDFDIKRFFLGDLLGLHGVHGSINAVIVGRLNAADRNSIVDAGVVNGRRQGVLRQLQVGCHHERLRRFIVSLAGVAEQLPHFLATARSGVPELLAPGLQLGLSLGRVIG